MQWKELQAVAKKNFSIETSFTAINWRHLKYVS
jgi:hypothetical protein